MSDQEIEVKSTKEKMIPMSQVQKMMEEVVRMSKEENKPLKARRVTEHTAHVWRFDGKWVVDFVDRNIDPETNEKIDPYIKDSIFAFNKFNEQKREFEAWITLKFNDGTTKEVPLNRYVQHRVLVYCPIVKREKVDASYSIGEVEKKKDNGDMLVGTGVYVDQEVVIEKELFHIKTPEGETLIIPDHAIA